MKQSNEAFWWSLVSAGGVAAALFLPAIVVLTGFVLPFAEGDTATRHEQLRELIGWWPVRVLLMLVISLSFFHCAHRMRHLLMDFGVRSTPLLLAVVFYAGAITGTVATVVVISRL